MSIENWFSVPIYVKDVDIDTQNKIYEEVSNTFDKLNQKDLSNPWGDDVSTTFKYGTSTNDIYRYKWSTLQSKVFESAAEFCREYKIEPPSIIKESWINFYTKNQYQSSHIHPKDRKSTRLNSSH